MLTTKLIHPEIMSALSYCGHGSKILIADPGLPTVTDVLKAIHSVIEIEKAEVMIPGDGSTPEIFKEFEEELGLPLSGVGRFEYYDLCCEPDVVLAISTGEKRVFANILLTVGCA